MNKQVYAESNRVDRKLAYSFGAVLLLLTLTAAGVASYLFVQLQKKEEDKLAGAIAVTLSESISRVSFSGKYHSRLLVEEMKETVPGIIFISVETIDGYIIAHSDRTLNDTLSVNYNKEINSELLKEQNIYITERKYSGKSVKEVVLLYGGGFNQEVAGIVRLGINVEEARNEQHKNLIKVLCLISALTAAAIFVVLLLSRHFGRAVRTLASQLQGILNHSPLSICITDKNGNLTAHSVEFENIFGTSVVNQSVSQLLKNKLSDSDIKLLQDVDSAIFESGERKAFELKFQNAERLYYWYISKFPIMKDKFEKVTLICTFIHDITEQRIAEAALESEKIRLETASTAGNVALWKLDIPSGLLEWSNIVDDMLGYNSGEFERTLQAWESILHPEDKKRVEDSLNSHLENDTPYQIDYRIRKKDGKYVWWHDAGNTLRDENGKPLSMAGACVDITDRKLAEIEKEQLQNQLVQSHKMESVGRLAGGVAHDFNNMLQAILGNLELAMADALPETNLYKNLEEVQKAAKRSADLTRQLLAFARKQTVIPKPQNLNDTVSGMLKMLQRLIGEDINLNLVFGADLWLIKIDPSQIDQILANLCVNARDAIDGVGKIIITTANKSFKESFISDNTIFQPGDYVMLSVSDNGRGIDNDSLEHIFEPFFTTKGIGQGTGLGLAMVYGIIKQNEGFINVFTELEKGTTINMYFPRYTGPYDEPLKNKVFETQKSRGETVLIIEDEAAILKLGKKFLERLNYNVITANTPAEALSIVTHHTGKIDLMITDVVMPEMNGRELASHIKKTIPDIKCIFISGYTADVIANRGMLEDSVAFLQKPFSFVELANKVNETLKKK